VRTFTGRALCPLSVPVIFGEDLKAIEFG
jgi:hypothetical protein